MHYPIRLTVSLLAAGSCCLALPAWAAPIAFTNPTTFAAAIDGYDRQVESFESTSPGTLVESGDIVGPLTFSYVFDALPSGDPLSLGVSSGDSFGGSLPAPTTDGTHFLATNDADLLLGGDDFTMSFAESNAFGLWIISADEPGVDIQDDDLVLEVAGISVTLDIDTRRSLSDDNFAYFLGVVDTAVEFSEASLTGNVTGAPTFVVDEITIARPSGTVPAPAMPILLLTGLIGLAAVRQRSARGA